MCDFFQKAVGSVENGAYLLHQMKKVRVDKRGICWNKHKRLLKGSFQLPEKMWTPQRCKELARETIQLVNCQVKCRINKVAFLAEDSKKTGTSLNWMTDLMINPFNMLSPLDIISVVLHEMAHQLVQYGHQHAVRSVRWDHCEAWEDALWYFTLFMVSEYINPMNIWCLMTLSLSLWYYLVIINIVILFCPWNIFSCFFFRELHCTGFLCWAAWPVSMARSGLVAWCMGPPYVTIATPTINGQVNGACCCKTCKTKGKAMSLMQRWTSLLKGYGPNSSSSNSSSSKCQGRGGVMGRRARTRSLRGSNER